MNRFLPLLALLLASCSGPAGALQTVDIASCYDGDTCRTTEGERIRLACIDTPELRGRNADPVPATAARDFLRRAIRASRCRSGESLKTATGARLPSCSKGA